jgi:hypothetical protein
MMNGNHPGAIDHALIDMLVADMGEQLTEQRAAMRRALQTLRGEREWLRRNELQVPDSLDTVIAGLSRALGEQ